MGAVPTRAAEHVCMCACDERVKLELAGNDCPRTGGPSTPTPTMHLTAELRGEDVKSVQAAVDGVREAYVRGDSSAVADALIAQARLLEALGSKLLAIAGAEPGRLELVQVYGNLGLRAFDQARKALGALADLTGAPRQQSNVQVNFARDANELMGGGRG